MEVHAHLSKLRISPRKVRLVADLIRGLDVTRAKTQLQFLVKKPALPILKLLNSAAANARHNFKLNPDEMYVSRIFVNEGQAFRRGRPQSRGRVHPIRKRTSHISLTLSEKKDRHQKKIKVKSKSQEKKTVRKKRPEVHAPQKKEKKKSSKRLTGLSRRVFLKNE